MFGSSWFGRGSKKDSATEAIVNARAHIETLTKRATSIEEKRDQQEAQARKLVTTNKAAARTALRRKKQYEDELDKIHNQILNFESQLAALESANLNRETMKVMKQGADAMRRINKDMNVDKLDQTMDDIRDQVALGDEISDSISRPLHELDETELDAEMELLEQDAVEERMLGAGRAPATSLPEVGSKTPAVEEDEDEEDEEEALRKLEAEMAV